MVQFDILESHHAMVQWHRERLAESQVTLAQLHQAHPPPPISRLQILRVFNPAAPFVLQCRSCWHTFPLLKEGSCSIGKNSEYLSPVTRWAKNLQMGEHPWGPARWFKTQGANQNPSFLKP